MPKRSLKSASTELSRTCPVMATLVVRHGPCRFGGKHRGGAFAALVRSICHQQLAGSAARAIHGRVEALLGEEQTPRRLLSIKTLRLRAAGLSGGKIESMRDLARKFEDGTVDGARLPRMRDQAIVEQLTQVRGIGEWTAQMFLIFQLERHDVWPHLDYGVRKGYAVAYGLPEMPTPKALAALGDRFAPFRSLAAWYCWRVLDNDA